MFYVVTDVVHFPCTPTDLCHSFYLWNHKRDCREIRSEKRILKKAFWSHKVIFTMPKVSWTFICFFEELVWIIYRLWDIFRNIKAFHPAKGQSLIVCCNMATCFDGLNIRNFKQRRCYLNMNAQVQVSWSDNK